MNEQPPTEEVQADFEVTENFNFEDPSLVDFFTDRGEFDKFVIACRTLQRRSTYVIDRTPATELLPAFDSSGRPLLPLYILKLEHLCSMEFEDPTFRAIVTK